MKKQLITTALTSSLLALSVNSAIAQTTISGNLDISYQAVSATTTNAALAGGNSYRGFGSETQINVRNSGKLSNGIDYAAGFSWEMDGPDTLTGGASFENNYIDFLFNNKATTLSFSIDHVNTTDQTLTNPVGYGYTNGEGISNNGTIYPKHLADNDTWGVGLEHNFGPLKATLNYQPNHSAIASKDVANDLISTQVEAGNNSARSLVLQGDLGVKGLNVLFGKKYEKAEFTTSATSATDKDGTRYAAAYTFGDVTVAADKIRLNGQAPSRAAAATTLANEELKGKSFGLAYSVNKELSLGVWKATATTNLASTEKEKTVGYAVGYNLGAVTVQAQYKDADNVGGKSDADGKIGGIKISTKF